MIWIGLLYCFAFHLIGLDSIKCYHFDAAEVPELTNNTGVVVHREEVECSNFCVICKESGTVDQIYRGCRPQKTGHCEICFNDFCNSEINAISDRQKRVDFCFKCSSKENGAACYDVQAWKNVTIATCPTKEQCQSFSYKGHLYRDCYSTHKASFCDSDTDLPCHRCSTDLCNRVSYKACYSCVDCWKFDPDKTMVCSNGASVCGTYLRYGTVHRSCMSQRELNVMCPVGRVHCLTCTDSLCNMDQVFACYSCNSSKDDNCFNAQTNIPNYKICDRFPTEAICGTIIRGNHIARDCFSSLEFKDSCSESNIKCSMCPNNLCNSEEVMRCFYCDGTKRECLSLTTSKSVIKVCRHTKMCLTVYKSKDHIIQDCMDNYYYEKYCKNSYYGKCKSCYTSLCNNKGKLYKDDSQVRSYSTRTFEISVLHFFLWVLLYGV